MKLDKAQTGNYVVVCLGVDADLLVYMKYVPMKPSKVLRRVILLSLEQRAFVSRADIAAVRMALRIGC